MHNKNNASGFVHNTGASVKNCQQVRQVYLLCNESEKSTNDRSK